MLRTPPGAQVQPGPPAVRACNVPGNGISSHKEQDFQLQEIFVPSASAAVPPRIKIGPQAGGMGAGGGLPRAGRQGGRPGRAGGGG